ncbi:DUF4427 domain-containing protein [Methylocystis parvus]|uniref:DUF4427 domain-containing protein n=1 Tax=Methylocystis parvus TaxID=134 RepID=A0A6B8M4H6_9HYPH|nr:DUF4427 domain-containing protein [Methylocystis parvus]QGM97258.1 DUF4427 domain-containing protein [Methylocystis parvus]WBJ98830.1 DUF4427 domain-containing protein [Methylocystis parvus OBBP]
MNNNARYDLSDRLIHFFRAVDTQNPNTPTLPEHWSFASIENFDEPLSPFFLMRNVVRQGRIWATWSVRSGRRTVYGPDPAVCFTEMPIAAFVEAGIARAAAGQAMSPYGLVLPKAAMFQLGARPVIYGLSGDISVTDEPSGARIIAPEQLPAHEQYRYVTYNPASARPIDWTHEREWRWPLRDAPEANPNDLPPDIENLYGLELDHEQLHGIGAIVKTTTQAEQLIYDILTKVDRGDIDENRYDFVLALDSVANVADLRDRQALQDAIDAARIDLAPYFAIKKPRAEALSEQFRKLVKSVEADADAPQAGEFGGCWLWITDNGHELTRALLRCEHVRVTKMGKYIAELYEFSDMRSLAQREDMTRELARRLKARFDVHATYLSVIPDDDPDGVPFYNGDELDDRKFYNYSDDEDDY